MRFLWHVNDSYRYGLILCSELDVRCSPTRDGEVRQRGGGINLDREDSPNTFYPIRFP